MPVSGYKIEYAPVSESMREEALPAIIVAAGMSRRMQGVSKLFAPLLGVPVIVHTIRAFENSDYVSRIIVVAREDELLNMQRLAEEYSLSKISDIIAGGESRQQSVKNGLSRLTREDTAVLIHDGARPLIYGDTIAAVALALRAHRSVTCAVPVKDTIKRVNSDSVVVSTPDRSELVSVQTPQGIIVADYLAAVAAAPSDAVFTDDTSVMESAGIETFVVDGDYHNIKITTREDLVIAEQLLKGERQ